MTPTEIILLLQAVASGAMCGIIWFVQLVHYPLFSWGVRDEQTYALENAAQAHRHQGLGSALMERIITTAKNRGIHQLHMICSRENLPMQQLAEKFGARFTLGHGEALGEIETDPVTPFSLLDEAMHDTTDFVTAVFDWSRV